MKVLTAAGALLLCAGISGCAAPPAKPTGQETFDTRITANGSKQFLYRIEIPYRKQRPGAIQNGSAPRGPSEELNARTKSIASKTVKRVAAILEETGFCRSGYFVLDRSAYGGQGYIPGESSLLGECKEGATTQDMQRFPQRGPLLQ